MSEGIVLGPPLRDEVWVYRAIKPSWAPAGVVLATAFVRSRRDRDGLSVTANRERGQQTYQRQRGVARLEVAQVRRVRVTSPLTLDVREAPTKTDPEHAVILGLPDPYPDLYSEDEEERIRANEVAEELVRIAEYPG